jgi:hypothetical protein
VRGRGVWTALLLATWLAACGAAAAQDTPATPPPAPAAARPAPTPEGADVVVGLGAIGVEPGENSAAALDLELRLRPRWQRIRPTLGILATADDTTFVRAGISRDFTLRRWAANVGFAVGAYQQGDGKYLGQTLQFRSALDLSYALREDLRLGVAVSHLSNAGLSAINPGIETLALTLAWRPAGR